MNNFEFISPTKIVFGQDAELKTGELVRQYADKALVVLSYGKTNATGVVTRTVASLKEAGVTVFELDGIRPNPVLSKVREGIEIVKREGIKFILAIGGGSIIDTAKAIAAGALLDDDVWIYFRDKVPVTRALPVGAVVTIPAAGSELSNSCVITDEELSQKLSFNSNCVRPVFAVENPAVTLSLSPRLTAAGCVDMFAHVIERYVSATGDTDLTDRFGESIMRTTVKYSTILADDPGNYEAREQIMLAGTFAHNGLAGLGRSEEWVSHGLGISMSALYDSIHGETLSVILPAWMKYICKKAVDRLVKLAVRVFDVEPDPANPERVALEGIRRMEAWFKRLGMPTTIAGLDIPDDDAAIDALVENYRMKAPRGGVVSVTTDVAAEIYRLAR